MQAPLRYLDLPVPEALKPTQIDEDIYWLRLPLPFALNHINLWLLADDDGWTLVDCGIGLPDSQQLWQQLLDGWWGGRRVQRIIVTHFHPDHLGQAAWLSDTFQAPVWMNPVEYATAQRIHGTADLDSSGRLAAFFGRHGLDHERVKTMAQRGNRYRWMVPTLPENSRPLVHGEDLSIGGHRWQVICGGGHSPEQLTLYCAERGLWISADQVLPRISSNISVYANNPEENPLKEYLASLEELMSLPEETQILPSHGEPFGGLHGRIQQLQAHHQERLEQLLAACTQPQTAADVLELLFRRPLDDHQIVFAMGEAIAHLNYLHQAGELERQDDQGLLRFSR